MYHVQFMSLQVRSLYQHGILSVEWNFRNEKNIFFEVLLVVLRTGLVNGMFYITFRSSFEFLFISNAHFMLIVQWNSFYMRYLNYDQQQIHANDNSFKCSCLPFDFHKGDTPEFLFHFAQ